MTNEVDVIEQGSWGPVPLPSRKTLIVITAVIATVLAGAGVAVARPWYHRTALPDPCRLLPAATMARYVPSAIKQGPVLFNSTTRKTGMCGWSGEYPATGSPVPILQLEVDEYATPGAARQDLGTVLTARELDVDEPDASTRAVSGVGDQARAFVSGPATDNPLVILEVRSGSTVLELTYGVPALLIRPRPDNTTVLTDTVAMARTALSDFGTAPAATASPVVLEPPSSGGPRYAIPGDPCRLVSEGTVARYLGTDAKGHSAPDWQVAQETAGSCQWVSDASDSLDVSVIAVGPASSSDVTRQAQQAVESCIEDFAMAAELDGGPLSTPLSVPDVGSQAEAVFVTGNTQSVALFTWSGNVEVSTVLQSPSTPELATATAVTRTVLAALPRT